MCCLSWTRIVPLVNTSCTILVRSAEGTSVSLLRASELQAIFRGSPSLEKNYVLKKKMFDLKSLIIIGLTRLKNNLPRAKT